MPNNILGYVFFEEYVSIDLGKLFIFKVQLRIVICIVNFPLFLVCFSTLFVMIWGYFYLQFFKQSFMKDWRDDSAPKEPAALPESRCPVPSTHTRWFTTSCNSSFRGFSALFRPLWAPIHVRHMINLLKIQKLFDVVYSFYRLISGGCMCVCVYVCVFVLCLFVCVYSVYVNVYLYTCSGQRSTSGMFLYSSLPCFFKTNFSMDLKHQFK